VVTFHRFDETTTGSTAQIGCALEGPGQEGRFAGVGVDQHQVKKDMGRFKVFIESRGPRPGSGAARWPPTLKPDLDPPNIDEARVGGGH
jgi:hypothetical protein